MCKSTIALNTLYATFCALFIYTMSYLEEEYYIGDRDIKDICVVYKEIIDDNRDVFAPVCLLIVSPLIYAVVKKRFKSLSLNIMTLALLAYWIWRFFIRLIVCI
ncbi:YjeO family protein [Photorhabdus heterorhabditis]|uniref:DUF2645 family protein n=1 Tax=Photorhabdus heterorhabditis TaxID=880156 RepID=A0A5B0WKJ9_9GAMM|nr:YjeO family protein [Photorhabdus heterorhabditis]KAA1187614.1 DUF2645 family protein [Photorhabdus heterorhabditis]KOY62569.1 hypothetical protein AM629_07810 [Photorhabdus heterorhabditis]MBS9442677.1 DUF2645 family protein [Photorhabdus heterorhabditis]